jgi:hypothetical protein
LNPDGPKPVLAAALYSGLSLILTWPLVLGIAGDVPGDLGDSLLNMWIIAWGAQHVPQLLTGAIGWPEFWNGNIFHPEPLTLALSEHLFGQTIQILPIYWLTGNIILCYNLLFISTFALSAFGTFLLVRDLTGSARAAFIAGLIYGFLPYRIASVPHLQVMSSQWMPFALYGLNRFVTSGSRKALAGGTAALVMQNWSCGYYLLYFAPFVPLFLLHRMWTLGTLRSVRTWTYLVAAAAGTLALTLPFLFPYRQAQALFALERPLGEVVRFSANVWSYLTASENVRLYGGVLRFYLYPEGETFLGLVPWVLAIVAVAAVIATLHPPPAAAPDGRGMRIFKIVLLAAAVSQFLALAGAVILGGFNFELFGLRIRATTPQRLLLQFIVVFGVLLALSPRMRARVPQLARSPVVFFFTATILAMWLSLGPMPNAGEARVSGLGIYSVLYDYVPGFNGVRVPARYAMIAGLFLAIVAGFGAAKLLHPPKRANVMGARGRIAVTVLAILILIEGAAIPFEINRTWNMHEATPPARVYPAHTIHRTLGEGGPRVYARVAALPAGSVITEFPFGDGAWEIRYVYYAAAHGKPITNGYSGGFPASYKERVARLQRVDTDPESAWQSLRASGTTHVVLHRNAFANPANADIVESWLKSRGATEMERFDDGDTLLSLP